MAKKKVTHQNQAPREENPQGNPNTQQQPSTEDPKEKLQNLKSLNSLLLKETFERRQRVESLVQAKDSLENELTRCFAENNELETELSNVNDERVSLEVEKMVFCVVLESLVAEMGFGFDELGREKIEKEMEVGFLKREINRSMVNLEKEREIFSRVCEERDVLRSDSDNLVREANGLRRRLMEVEKKERKTEEEVGNLEEKYHMLIWQKRELEENIEELKRTKDLAQSNLVERLEEIESLEKEIEGIVSEKNAIEIEKNGLKVKIIELEKEVQILNGILSSLQEEERVMREKILELEKSCVVIAEKEKAMRMEIDSLKEEKREKEGTISMMMEERDSRESYRRILDIELMKKNELIEKLLTEKNEIEAMKASKESEIAELHEEISRLMNFEFAMQESIKRQEDKNKELASEASHYRDALEQLQLERDDAFKALDEEKKTVVILKLKLQEMETRNEETDEKFAKMKTEHENLISKRNGMESKLGSLKKEKDTVEKNLLEEQKELENLRTRIESANNNSERALKMLKSTVALVCQSDEAKEGVFVTERKLCDETDPYVAELEIIKNAFRNKETVFLEMKQHAELLQDSMAKVRKQKNNLWTTVTSATTILAAAFLAYVAKAR